MILRDVPPVLLRAIAGGLGLLWGSFLNVVIHRVPREMSVVRPGSTCPGCGKPIAPWDNLPVVSWLLLRGRARCCGMRIDARYPLVELLGGFSGVAIVDRVISRMPEHSSFVRAAFVFIADFALSLGLIAGAFIDFEHMYLPDAITIGGAVLGIATSSLRGMSLEGSLLGAAIGFGMVYVPFTVLYKRLLGRTGMGAGDAKLTALAGAWFGWPGALLVLFGGAIQGVIAAAVLYLFKGKIEEPESVKKDREELLALAERGDEEAKQLLEEDPVLGEDPSSGLGRMPFGPFLILAILELLLFGREIKEMVGGWLLWDRS